MSQNFDFDELKFLKNLKKRPGSYLGRKSLLSLRDHVFGMSYAFAVCGKGDALKYFHGFIEWYNKQLFETDQNGYVCWWNHILYTSGNHDDMAFDSFYGKFESYLRKEHGITLSENSEDESRQS